jgi:uncharacterized protein (DUF305 family)
MTTTTPILRAGAALAAALTLAGCSAGDTGATPESSTAAEAESGRSTVNDADEMFVQMMRPHHEQAIEMSDMLLGTTGISGEVTALATEIRDAQVPEIEQLSAWADEWGIEEMSGMDHGMEGMVSDSDVQELDEAEGAEAERLFLEHMIEHHTGAVEMAQTEIADGRNSDAIEMAEDIVATQEDEISRMRALLGS